MPILDDIMDHDIIGPAIRQGIQQGRLEAWRDIVRHQIEKRFGALPTRLDGRFLELSATELDGLALRMLDASSLEELVG